MQASRHAQSEDHALRMLQAFFTRLRGSRCAFGTMRQPEAIMNQPELHKLSSSKMNEIHVKMIGFHLRPDIRAFHLPAENC